MYFLLDICCKAVNSRAEAKSDAHAAAAAAAAAAKDGNPQPPLVVAAVDRPPFSGEHRGQVAAQPVQPTAHALHNPAPAAAAAAAAAADAETAANDSPDGALQPSIRQANSNNDTASKLREAFEAEPCKKRACTTAVDMFAAFQESRFSQQKARGGAPQPTAAQGAASQPAQTSSGGSSLGTSSNSSSSIGSSAAEQQASGSAATHAAAATPAAVEQLPEHLTADGQPSSNVSQQQQQQQTVEEQQQQQQHPFWFYEDEMPCPPDILELGRSTWTLLHSMAACYPDHPTEQQQKQMFTFIDALGEFYPCDECAGHFRKELRRHPPDVTNAAALSDWTCRLHNLVNVRLGKPEFDCSKVFERWRDGPAGNEDACGTGH